MVALTAFFVLSLIVLVTAQWQAPLLSCPLNGCAEASKPTGSLSVCAHYSELSCCSASQASAAATALNEFADKFSNEQCKTLLEDAVCGFHCSATQHQYMRLFQRSPVGALYRVCDSFCTELFDSCKLGTFDGNPAVLEFETAEELCQRLPVGDQVLVESVAAEGNARTCFSGRETEQRVYSLLFGPGLGGVLTNTNTSFTINAIDGFNTPVTVGGDEIRVNIEGPNMFDTTPTDNGDGTYTVSYSASIGGYYDIEALVEDSKPDLVPIRVSVTQQSICPVQDGRSARPEAPPAICSQFSENSCCVTDDHYQGVQLQQEDFADAFEDAACRDIFNELSCGISCSPEQSLFFDPNTNTTGEATFALCTDYCDTWYAACRDAQMPSGTMGSIFTTSADFCKGSIQNDRFSIVLRDELCFNGDEPRKSCRNSYAEGDGLYNYLTGDPPSEIFVEETNTFTIQAVDIFQNRKLEDNQPFNIEFNVPGVMATPVTVDGETTVTWSTNVAGSLLLSVTCDDGEHIEHSPFPIIVRPGPFDTAELECPEQGSTSSLVLVDVWALDKFGNRLDRSPENANLRVKVEGPDNYSAEPELVDNCDGSFTAAFQPRGAGSYRVLLFDGDDVNIDDCTIPVLPDDMPTPAPTPMLEPGAICANTTTLSGPGLLPLPSGASAETVLAQREFFIETRDAQNRTTTTTDAAGRFRIDFFIEDPEAGLINLRNPANEETPSPEAMETFRSLIPSVSVAYYPDAPQTGTYVVRYTTRIASDLIIFVVLEPEEEECGGIVTGRPVGVPGSCDRECLIGGVCTYATVDSTDTSCECIAPVYNKCMLTDADRMRFPDLPANIVCCPAAPTVTGIRFADDPSTSIILEFSTETDQAGMHGRSDCGVLLEINEDGTAPLGDDSYCVWRDQRSLLVWFGSDATVLPGDEISLQPQKLYAGRFPSNAAASEQAIRVIDPPTVPPVPVVAISGPETYNPCTPFELDASYSIGSGGRAMDFTWSILTPATARPAREITLINDISAYLESQTTPVVQLPENLINRLATDGAGRSFQFAANAENHFNQTSRSTGLFQTKVDLDTASPQVRIVPPTNNVVRSKDLKLTAEVIGLGAGCDDPLIPNDRELDYTWSQASGPAFDLGLTTLKTFYIPANTLVPGTEYTFELNAAYKVRPVLGVIAHVTVRVMHQPLVAVLAGGNRLYPLAANRPLTLDASGSYDPDESGRPLQYRWEITAVGSPSTRLLTPTQESTLLNPGTNGISTVTLPVDVFEDKAGEWLVSLTLSAENDMARAASVVTQIITVVERGGPIVSVTGPPAGLFNPNGRLELRGDVQAESRDGPLELSWRTVGGLFDLDINSTFVATVTSGPDASENLVILPGAFASGARYVLRLEAQNDAGIGFAEYVVEANAQPNAGRCDANRYSGQSLLDEFVVTCRNYEDLTSQLPLSYRVFRRPVGVTDNSQDFPLNIAQTQSPIMRFRMFQGNYQIVVLISDALGAAQQFILPQPFSVSRSGNNNQLLDELEKELDNAPGNSDADKLLNAIDIITQILKDEAAKRMERKRQNEDDVSEARQAELRNRVVSVVTSDLRTEQSVGTTDTKLRLLNDVASTGAVSADAQSLISQYLGEQAAPSFALGITDRTALDTIELIGRVLASVQGELLETKEFGEGIRDGIEGLTSATLRELLASEAGRIVTYENLETDEVEIEWNVEKTRTSRALKQVQAPGVEFSLPDALFEGLLASGARAQSIIGYEILSIRQPLFLWADGAPSVISEFAINGLTLFDNNGEELSVDADGLEGDVVSFNILLDQERVNISNRTRGVCLFFDGQEYSEEGCEATRFTEAFVSCECTHLTDFAASLTGALLPAADGPLLERARQLREEGNLADQYLWLLLLLLLLLWCTLCVVGCLVLYHRRQKPEESCDTLQPYLDKAAGMGTLGIMAGAGEDVSDSSELERRDYALPVGVYEIPEQTDDSDVRRDDFSWALSGESETPSELGSDGEQDADSEIGRTGDTYKESRLAKMAGGAAGATKIDRGELNTGIDLDITNAARDEPDGTVELDRKAGTDTKATRD